MTNDLPTVLDIVAANPAALHVRGPVGEKPIHMAAIYRHKDLLQAMLERFPDEVLAQYEGTE